MDILKSIPSWVVVTFFIYTAYGLAQFRARQVRAFRLVIQPSLIVLLTLASVLTGTLDHSLCLLTWLLGMVLAAIVGNSNKTSRGLRYSYQTKLIYIPGSWVPLLLMMLIYATLFMVNDISGEQHMQMNVALFSILVGLVYGLISGVFVARMLSAWQVKRRRLSNLIS